MRELLSKPKKNIPGLGVNASKRSALCQEKNGTTVLLESPDIWPRVLTFFIKKTVRGNQICPSLSKLSPSMLLLTQQLKISRTKAAAMLHYMHGEQPQHLQDLPVII